MTQEKIERIEKELQPDGLAGYLFYMFCNHNVDNLCEISQLPEGGVGLIMKGTASIQERREMFLKVYDGCKNISEYFKKSSRLESNQHPLIQSKK